MMAKKPACEELKQRIKDLEEGSEGSAKGHRAKAALRDDEVRFRKVFEIAPLGIVVVGPDFKYVDVNKAFADFVGYSREELLSINSFDLTHPEDRAEQARFAEKAWKGEIGTYSLQKRYVRKDGEIRWGGLTSTVFSSSEQGRYRLGIVDDITERKQAEDAVRASEERFRTIFDSSNDAIFIFDLSSRFLEVNQAACERLGYTREELLRMSPADIDTPHFAHLAPARIRAAEEEGQLVFEAAHRRKDGTEFPVEINSQKIQYEGKPCLLSVVRDITNRKRTEEALRTSEEKYRNLYDDAPMAYMEYDIEGVITKVNRKLLEMLGHDAEGVLGHPVWEFVVEKEARDVIKEKVASARSPSKDLERTYRRKDGTPVTVLINDVFVKDDNDRIVGIRVTIQDITERKRMEEEKDRLQAQLLQAQKMESVGRLAGGVAHDFNNMLGVIIGNAELALMETKAEDPFRQNVQEILKASQRSTETVRQLLAFARKQTISPLVLDLNDTVPRVLKMLRRLIGEDVELRWIPGKDVETVRMDPNQINQILMNLVVNSRDAIPGVGTITIESAKTLLDESYCRQHSGAIPGEYVRLTVSDTGTGMSKEIMEHLFDPFFTTKEVGKGTGLGLATVYGIVTQNNGVINVYSEPDRGTTFKIYLPRFEGEAVSALEEEERKLPEGTETVLVAEDEAPLLTLARKILTKVGYTVLPAHSPTEALSLAEEHVGEIHLLLTDVVMPEMNGPELMEKLHAIRPAVKGLFMSGYTADVVAQQGVLDEGIHFIEKPFSPKALADKVREVLDKR